MTTPNENALPSVDVIILSWNRTEPTLEAIDSALAQQNVTINVYVFDQGSNEDSIKALRERQAAGKIHLTENGYNIGAAAGRNRAMEAGTGQYIVGIDNDAEFQDETMLERVVQLFEDDETLGLLGFRILKFYNGEDDEGTYTTYPSAMRTKLTEPFLTSRFVACGFAIRRDVLEQTKGFDEKVFIFTEERDLAYQVINAGYKVRYSPEIVVRHKVSPEGRFAWRGNRYYMLARNAAYLDYKYYRQPMRTFFLLMGYIARGIANKVPGQGFRGTFDSLKMIREITPEMKPLSENARQYIWENDGKYRGTILQRAQRDITRRLE